MHITHLSLTNFRNYGRLERAIPQGALLLYGNNAQGKTNLLEAIYYLATTRSPHAEYDHQLINWEAAQTGDPIVVGRIAAQIMTQSGEHLLEMRLIQEDKRMVGKGGPSFRRQALVNRRKVRLMDLLGKLRVVLFLPEDIQLITGSPSERRRYLNITLCQIDPIYCHALSHYNKILEQRNALLRQIAEGVGSKKTLPIFTDKLVELGSKIFARRALFIKNISREAQHIHYESLTLGQELIQINYLPRIQSQPNGRGTGLEMSEWGSWLQEHHSDIDQVSASFHDALQQAEPTDMVRGTTSVGPHRDDWQILVNNRNLRHYGSRGQQRSAILALKMAEIKWMAVATGETPILLLDEVVAELDAQRREALLTAVNDSNQAVLTATDPTMFSEAFLTNSNRVYVKNGRIYTPEEQSK